MERLGRKAWGVFDGLSPAELDAQDAAEDVVADPRREMFTEVWAAKLANLAISVDWIPQK